MLIAAHASALLPAPPIDRRIRAGACHVRGAGLRCALLTERSQASKWKDFAHDNEAERLVLAARAAVPDMPRARADARVIEQIRQHHLRLERLVVEACDGDVKGWGILVQYRADTVVVCCSIDDNDPRDRFNQLVVVAWRMVDESGDEAHELRTCIGLSREEVIDAGAYRPGLPEGWPAAPDLRGIGIERALSLVEDFGDPDQVLLSGGLVHDFEREEIEELIDSGRDLNLCLNPTKDDAQFLHAELRSIPVAQIAWDAAAPGTLTNRQLLARELKEIQPKVSKLIEYFNEIDGPLVAAYSGEAGAAEVPRLDGPVVQTAKARLHELEASWRQSVEAREQDELCALVEKTADDYASFVSAFRNLQAAINREDSGARSDARIHLQDRWQECRATPHTLMDCVQSLVERVYS